MAINRVLMVDLRRFFVGQNGRELFFVMFLRDYTNEKFGRHSYQHHRWIEPPETTSACHNKANQKKSSEYPLE